MSNNEKEEIKGILEFLITTGELYGYTIEQNKITVKTKQTNEEEIDFLKFKILMAIAIVNEEFEQTIKIEVIN